MELFAIIGFAAQGVSVAAILYVLIKNRKTIFK